MRSSVAAGSQSGRPLIQLPQPHPFDLAPMTPNAASSPLCSAIWSARLTVGPARAGRSARGHRHLSPLLRRSDRARRRVCRQVHGGQGARLFRLLEGRRERCQTRGTGLALVDAAAGLDTTAGLSSQVRVGIDTGLVVVGDLPSSSNCWQPRVKGLTLMVNSIYNGNRFEDLRVEE